MFFRTVGHGKWAGLPRDWPKRDGAMLRIKPPVSTPSVENDR
ncbi:Hypothetical protein BSPT1_I1612 [Brucella suis bv. 2]|nr:Hypothetical protein BSPT1_I1612 [Brucella suis bv. 2]